MPDHHLSEDSVTRSAEALLRVGDYPSNEPETHRRVCFGDAPDAYS